MAPPAIPPIAFRPLSRQTRAFPFLFALLLLASFDFATPAGNVSCSAGTVLLDTAGALYTLNATGSINGATCFNITAANVTLDCAGFSITGNNSTNTYGIYTNQFNTTIRNCNISNFMAGIYFSGATNGTISDTNITTTYSGGGGIALQAGSNGTTLSNLNVTANGRGICTNSSHRNTYTNVSTLSETTHSLCFTVSDYNVILTSDAASKTSTGMYFTTSKYNTITNSTARNTVSGTTGYGVKLITSSHGNSFIGTTASSVAASGFYVDGGSNTAIDCQGKSIIGTNTSSTYGIYSDQFNTTIRNCNISNFATGIYFNGADNGTIENTTTHTTAAYSLPSGNGIYLYNEANYNTIRGSSGYSAQGRGIYIHSSSNYNTVSNSTGTAGTYGGIYIHSSSNNTISNSTGTAGTSGGFYFYSSSNYNTISNSTGTAGTNGGIYIYFNSNYNTITNSTGTAGTYGGIYLISSSNYNTIANSQINGKHDTYGALYISTNCTNNTIANSTINGLAATRAVTLQNGLNTGNLLINNTILNATDLLWLDENASSNTFCLNNFTATSGAYVNDANGSNFYNCTYDAKNQGNIWANVMNGSVSISGSINSSITGLYIGSTQNYTNATSLGKFSCNATGCADYAPLTPNSSASASPSISAISILPSSPNSTSILACNVTAESQYNSTLSLNITWQRNGTAFASSAYLAANATPFIANLTLNSTITGAGDNWSCSAWANDSFAVSATNFTANVTVAGASRVLNINKSTYYDTIQGAIDAADAGDHIRASAGTYYENVNVNRTVVLYGESMGGVIVDGGMAGNPITVQASGANVYNFTVTNALNDSDRAGVRVPAGYGSVTVSRINATGNTAAGIHASSNGTIIEDCIASDNIWGIRIDFGANYTVRNCVVYGNQRQDREVGGAFGQGIRAVTVMNSTLENNTIYGNARQGILITDACLNVTVSDSAIYSNGANASDGGIEISSSNSSFILNNTIRVNAGRGLNLGTASGNMIRGNSFFNNTAEALYLDLGSDPKCG